MNKIVKTKTSCEASGGLNCESKESSGLALEKLESAIGFALLG